MQISRLTTVVALASALAAVSASAQVHPVLERGFSPESVYQVGDIDSINTFNGNLVVSIPVGPSYPVGGRLSYQLTLTYNSLLWDYSMQPDDARPACERNPAGDCVGLEAVPSLSANAGLGWRLSLGDLLAPHRQGNSGPNWVYVAPDGSRHTFVQTLHEGDPVFQGEPAIDNVWYTRDNTYMRLSVLAVGGAGNPVWMKIEGANGIERIFTKKGNAWRLWKIRDTFANHLDITYGTNLWTLTDSVGRTQRVYWTTVAGRSVVSRVELTAFGSASPAVYQLTYHNAPVGTEIEESCKDTIFDDGREQVPLLTAVTLPDGSRYRMASRTGDPAYYARNGHDFRGCSPYSGVLNRLVVPTGGTYEWTHDRVSFPPGAGSGCPEHRSGVSESAFKLTAGVSRRTVTSAPGQAAQWRYAYPVTNDPEAESIIRTVTSPEGHDTVYHFNTERCEYDQNALVGWKGWAYGLPYSPTREWGARYASVEYFEGTGSGRKPVRTRYVRYEHDQLPHLDRGLGFSWHDSNRRLSGTLVRHHDDPGASSAVSYADFDGLGHYREVRQGGFGTPTVRIETARYNPERGTYAIDDDNDRVGFYDMLSPDDPWVLGTYDSATQAEGAVTAKQEFCFDGDTGLLTRTRTLMSGTSRNTRDLLTRFVHDIRGNLAGEHFHGGDRYRIGTGSLCTLGLSSPDYGLLHEYQYGTRRRSTYAGTSVHTLDADVDPRTGLVSRSRDVSGLGTRWAYDGMGRLTAVTPDEGARVGVTYHPAAGDVGLGFGPARIDVAYRGSTGASTLAAEAFEFDGRGRPTVERRLLPDGSWATKETRYRTSGQVDRVSGWTGDGATPAWTTYSDYDAFGRAGRVTTPDGRAVVLTFIGERAASSTVSVGTSGRGTAVTETPFTTTTYRDYRGRVTEVHEPVSATATILSSYGYDIGGRLARVTVAAPEGTQVRELQYDNRGFLRKERMPEKGASGNGAVTHGSYDARGHSWSMRDGSNRLTFIYDAAERLTRIRETHGAKRTLERRDYGTASTGGNWMKGKLRQATRHNYLDSVHDFRVVEEYVYRGLGGRVSSRTTIAGVVGEKDDATFVQGFDWTGMGSLQSSTYPRLGDIGPGRTVTYEYTNGFLSAVPLFANSITYHPNGMTSRVTHGNGVVDQQTLDAAGMARPSRIRSRHASKNWSTGTYRYDGAGNIIGMGGDWFLYDGLGRVTEGTTIRADASRGRQRYWYDGLGNLTRTWTAGQGNRYLDVAPTTNRIVAATYDASGNQTTWGSGPLSYQYSHSPFNQIHTLTGGSPAVTRFYAYTVDGERIASSASDTDTLTYTLRDLGGRALRDYERILATGAWSWKQDYVWGANGLLATVDAEGTRHFHVDHLGTPRLITDATGLAVARHNYYPFGEEATDPFQDSARMKFTGHERDLNLDGQTTDDLDYMHARFFNPNLGRFLSVDPVSGHVGSSQSWNRYSYAWNNPINLTDPRWA